MNEYKYVGVELTPNIFAELLISHFDGKQFKRSVAIDIITKYHKNNGGSLNKKDYIAVFKKACSSLSKNGLVNIGYGTWRLNYEVQELQIIEDDHSENAVPYNVDKTIGTGAQAVYVYYYDTYKKYAESIGNHLWECKIGRTDRDPLQRIFGQAGTCYPELPHIALVIQCDNSSSLESVIHNILKLRNRWIESAPGTEWFFTTPAEIESIYKTIIGE